MNMFESVMEGRWNDVVSAYTGNFTVQAKKITASKETALHLAVRFGQTEIVKQLVGGITGNNASRILELANERGETALHFAAVHGDVAMCYCIAVKDPSRRLITKRNCKGETPLFLAALHGKEKAFWCLDDLFRETCINIDYSLYKTTNGDTILHSAILREHFSLALQIIRAYPVLVNFVNNNGFSSLHILASKPNAFASSSRIGLFESLIYNCTRIDVKKEQQKHQVNHEHLKVQAELLTSPSRAENYQSSCNSGPRTRDEENPLPEGYSFQRCGNTIKNLCAAMVSLVGAAIVCICFDTQAKCINKVLKILTSGLLDIEHIIFRGIWEVKSVKETKKRHKLALHLLGELVSKSSIYKYPPTLENLPNANEGIAVNVLDAAANAGNVVNLPNASVGNAANLPNANANQENESEDAYRNTKKETPILIAARMGVTEVVKKILDEVPVASWDFDSDHKNVVLLAAENRQTEVYKLLLKKKQLKKNMFLQLDCQGNSALHLAATFNENLPGNFPEAATHMRWEVQWYKFVKHSMPPHFFTLHNKKGKTPEEIFTYTHKELVKRGSEWLVKTSESCSVVAALIATVAFATSATVPGGNNQLGLPIFEGSAMFDVYAISSLLALCFSITALVYFLAIRTSGFKENDFAADLPKKLFVGLASLFASMAFILLSFCSRHSLMLDGSLKTTARPIYIFTGLTVIILFIFHLPFYYRLLIFNF